MRENLKVYFDFLTGFEMVGMASSAEEALEMLSQDDADDVELLLVDFSLPAMNGVELVEEVKARRPELRAVIISGHDEAIYGERARAAGADGYVMKGDAGVIAEAVRHVCDGGRYFNGAPESASDA